MESVALQAFFRNLEVRMQAHYDRLLPPPARHEPTASVLSHHPSRAQIQPLEKERHLHSPHYLAKKSPHPAAPS